MNQAESEFILQGYEYKIDSICLSTNILHCLSLYSLTGFRLSRQLVNDVISIHQLLHRVVVCDDADASDVHPGSIFRVGAHLDPEDGASMYL
jgi:hypothetical protein